MATSKRQQILTAWLERNHAEKLWGTQYVADRFRLEGWRVGKSVIVVQLSKSGGWELFVPASDSGLTSETLDAAAMRLGVEGCAGLIET